MAAFTEEGQMTYASTSIDRRAQYYAKCADVIASDPLDFYTRAEKGRRFLTTWMSAHAIASLQRPEPSADLFEPRLSAPKLGELLESAQRNDRKSHGHPVLSLVRGSLAA
jgi:hypothetical protein